MNDNFYCRAMVEKDLGDVIRIQAEAYIDEILETDDVIYSRFANTSDTSWVVERSGTVCGYLVGYHSSLGEVTPWGQDFAHKPHADTLYLHDLAISKSAAGSGLGPLLVTYALQQAKAQTLAHAALVSVQNSKLFWEKMGFSEHQGLSGVEQGHLDSYAGPAFYMLRYLAE